MKKLLLGTTLILALTLIAIYVFTKEFSEAYALYGENKKIKSKIEGFTGTNEELEKRIEILKKDQLYIEKIARDELGMIKQGEKVYRFEE
jgi:cell division protein FtsB